MREIDIYSVVSTLGVSISSSKFAFPQSFEQYWVKREGGKRGSEHLGFAINDRFGAGQMADAIGRKGSIAGALEWPLHGFQRRGHAAVRPFRVDRPLTLQSSHPKLRHCL